MVKIIRRFQKPILFVVVFVVIISFVVFLNLPSAKYGGARNDHIATAYGRNFTVLDGQKARHRLEICGALQMSEMLFLLGGRDLYIAMLTGRDSGASAENFVWNSVVLRHEADQLGVVPTPNEVAEAIKSMPVFQTNGGFDYSHYAQFLQNYLSPKGLTQQDFEELIGDQVRIAKVRTLVGSTVEASPAEVREQYVQQNQKTDVSLFRLKLEDFKAAVQVSDEDVAKLFEQRKETLKTPEKRKVKFVAFTMAGEQKPLVGEERARESERLSSQAQELAQAMTVKGTTLEAAAEKFGGKVAESPLFTVDNAPAELGKSEQAAEAAFKLTTEQPDSDVVGAENGYYVLQLSGTEPSRPLTLEEAKPQLTEQLKQERAQEAMGLKAAALRNQIIAEQKAGKSFEDAAKTAGVTLEKFPTFSAADPKRDQPDARTVTARAAELKDDELSEFLPTPTGGLVMHVDKRQPIDEAAFEKEKGKVAEQIEQMKSAGVFEDWLRERRAAAKIEIVRG